MEIQFQGLVDLPLLVITIDTHVKLQHLRKTSDARDEVSGENRPRHYHQREFLSTRISNKLIMRKHCKLCKIIFLPTVKVTLP